MPIVSQGNSVVLDVGAHDGLWIKSTGRAEVTVNQVYAGTPEVINVTTETVRVGFYGEPVTVSIRAVSGQAEYQDQQFNIQPLTAVQDGDRTDSSPLDIKLAVNGVIQLPIKARYKAQGAVKIGGKLQAVGSAYQNKTSQATFLLRSAPARIRVHFLNCGAATVTGLKASVAVSANVTSWAVPSGGVGTFQLLTVPTTIPAATVNAGLDSALPTEVVSDWFVPNCIPRNDGGDGFILMLRVFQDATSSGMRMFVGGTSPTPQADFAKYEVVTGLASASGDFTTTATTFTENGGAAPAFWLECDYETPTATVAIVGDSVMQGSNGDPGVSSAAYGAAFQALQQLNATGKRCQLFNGGWSGAPTHGTTTLMGSVVSGYLGQFISYANAGLLPSIAAFCPWSVNNTGTYLATQLNSVRQSIAVFVSLCNNLGIQPVLVTPAPRNGLVEADESQRRICVEYIKSYCASSGVPLIDRDGVYTNYSVPTGGYKLPEWCIDNIHPTAAGHAVEAVEWRKVLDDLI